MRALRTLLPGMAVTAMLGAFALTTVFLPSTTARAAPPTASQTTKNSSPVGNTPEHAGKPADGSGPAVPSSSAGQPDGQTSGHPSEQISEQFDTPQAASLPLLSPIRRTAQCPAALPAHADRRCAEAFALLEALNAAVEALPQRREIRMGIVASNQYPALAAALYATLVEPVAETGSLPAPERRGVAVTLLARPNAAERLAALLRNPDALLLRRMLLEDYAATAATARKIADDMAAASSDDADRSTLPPGSGGTWYVAKATPPGQLTQHAPQPTTPPEGVEDAPALHRATEKAEEFAGRLEATSAALDALELSSEGWLARADSLAALQQAARRLPDNAAVRLLLAEAQLQAGLPQRCVDSCTEALGLLPGLTRARYIRALAHWRLQQLALAEDDLTVALEKTPENPLQTPDRSRLLRARGALRMLRDDARGMCADLTEACALGDCEGLAAAREQHFCMPPAPAPATGTDGDKKSASGSSGQKDRP